MLKVVAATCLKIHGAARTSCWTGRTGGCWPSCPPSRGSQLADELPEVTECHRITGEDCFLLKLHAATMGDIEAILDRFLLYGQTTTSVVVSTPVPLRCPPLPDP